MLSDRQLGILASVSSHCFVETGPGMESTRVILDQANKKGFKGSPALSIECWFFQGGRPIVTVVAVYSQACGCNNNLNVQCSRSMRWTMRLVAEIAI